MSEPEQPRRRFAPVPIETTYSSVRKSSNAKRIGPNPELTPDQSPRSTTPTPRETTTEKRKFAPQLIETSRRSRRVGDAGPATRPTDKTDITPYTNHIYIANQVKQHGQRREWDRSSDGSSARPMPPTRRETEDEAVKEYLLELAAKAAERQIQEDALAAFPNSHAREGGVAHFYFQEGSDSDETSERDHPVVQQRHRRQSSNLGLTWWHKHMQEHVKQTTHEQGDKMDVDPSPTDAELDKMQLSSPPDPIWTTSSKAERKTAQGQEGGIKKPADTDFASPSATKPVDKGWQDGPFGTPFAGFSPKVEAKDKKPKGVSPPMLGEDLEFRMHPSPQHTKLETDHPFTKKVQAEKHRDVVGGGGLWRGYCYRTESDETYIVPSELKPAPMISTPYPAATPGGPLATDHISDEPLSSLAPKPGLHALQNLDERLLRAQARAEKNEKIAQEFNDEFVTQVYNYLSLGYPSMARGFDDELSRISRIGVDELKASDEQELAKGHLLHVKIEETGDGEKCPRWRALRVYITEWARQHPDLHNLDPLAWGVRERRGSWGI